TLDKAEIAALIAELQARDVRIMGIEGADPSCLGPGLPPLLKGGRAVGGLIDPSDPAPAQAAPAPTAPAKTEPTFLLVDSPVRSGQSVVFPSGDVTVVGSVASGAEVIAGGSIHVYGA